MYKSSYIFTYFFLAATLFIVSCSKTSDDIEELSIPDDTETPIDSDTDTGANNTTASDLFESFITENGGESSFTTEQLLALETLLLTQEDLEAGRLAQAQEKIDHIFNLMPFSDTAWEAISSNSHCTDCPFNFGNPTAYYGLRMLEQIIALGNPEGTETLTMTAVIAPCAAVTRPTLPNYTPETVNVTIAPEIIANDGRLLQVATALFRRWVQAITGGLKVDLNIHILDDCTTVDYTDDGNVIVSYPDAESMVDAVPNHIAEETDFWWVIAPSGVPGTGAGYDRFFVTGGMGVYGAGLPLFLSDDAWFIRKPAHLGIGSYHEVEVRAYHPQWFQHEFMHHIYRKWPEFGLEETSHQWFDNATWPADFIGEWEPDYYIESITKRFLNASPSLAEGLQNNDLANAQISDPSLVVGLYERIPVENEWHEVQIVLTNGLLSWQNAAGFMWSLTIIDGELWTGADCPYGIRKLTVVLDTNQEIESLYFNGESYEKIN